MITLSDITMAQFIDLITGNPTDLSIPKEEIGTVTRDLVIEYREIADPTGVRIFLTNAERLSKSTITETILRICQNLLKLKESDKVREILKEMKINADRMTESRLKAEVSSRLARAIKEKEDCQRANKDESGEVNARREFDALTATLMAHFKFQIDLDAIKASIYANLVARFNREVKAMQAAYKK